MIDALLSAMRGAVERTLSTPASVLSRTRSRTATGGNTYTWTTTDEVLGRFMASSNAEMEYAAKMGVSATHTAILPYDVAVGVDDRLRVGGVDYAVVGVVAHTLPVLIKVMCARVEE